MNEGSNVMNNQEIKRLEKLQVDAAKDAGAYYLQSLTFPDLLLLLKHDARLRELIRSIVESPADEQEAAAEEQPAESVSIPIEPEEIAPPPAPVDTLRAQLADELDLLNAVRTDAELADDWLLPDSEHEGQQLVRLIARVSQWDTIMDLWDLLANRCKQDKRAASSIELQILTMAVKVHNLRWLGRQAKLNHVELGAQFDYRHHQRGTPTGEIIRSQWLPGLTNAGGEIPKNPLVQT